MCGIVGYIGYQPAGPIIFKCLEKMEYRGYDSSGVAILNGEHLSIQKDSLRVSELYKSLPPLVGSIGIGHTRWATCGEPSRANAHPHTDCEQKIAVVHNGIIINFLELRKILVGEGHIFTSETDTEVLPHLIEKYYDGDLGEAVARALKDIKGSYAIAVVRSGEDKLVLAKQRNPMVVGFSEREYFVASDATALLDHTNRVMNLEDGDICIITTGGCELRRNGTAVPVKEEHITWESADTQLFGFRHYMLKEINEQPRVVTDTLAKYESISNEVMDLMDFSDKRVGNILIVACGSSYHAALLGKCISEEMAGMPIRVELASEFNDSHRSLSKTTAIAISQSGETADTLQAARKIKAAGCKLVSITNVRGSQLSRIADLSVYTTAGPEISVAATKTFIAQIAVLYSLAISHRKGDSIIKKDQLNNLFRIPMLIKELLDDTSCIQDIGQYLAKYETVLFVARGMNYPVALEGALKLMEVSYIHAEGFAAGELKHGPFSLLDSRTPVVAIVAHDRTYDAMLTNIREIRTRKAPVIALVDQEDEYVSELADKVIKIPRIDPLFSPMLNVVALQLMAYYAALARGCPIDFPRNLAKTVTVE